MADERITVRCSSLPLFMSCSNAVADPDNLLRIEQEHPATGLGTDIHAACEHYARTGELKIEHLRQRVTPADFERARAQVDRFTALWAEAKEYMAGAEMEVTLEADTGTVHLIGHADYLKINTDTAYLLDLKTGRVHDDHYHQMAGYAYCAWYRQGKPSNFTVYVAVVYLEDDDRTAYTFDAETLAAWARDVNAKAQAPGYTINRRCVYCPVNASCPAYAAHLTRATAAVSKAARSPHFRKLKDGERAKLFTDLKAVERSVWDIKRALREQVERFGPLPTGDGREWQLRETESKRVDSALALPVLQDYLGDEELYECIDVSLSAVLDRVMSRAARGTKNKAKEEVLEALTNAGALTTDTDVRLELRQQKVDSADS